MKFAPRYKDKSLTREEVFQTLSIAALIHETDEGVRTVAKALAAKAPRSLCKSVLWPLSESKFALDIVLEEMVFPSQEKEIGTAGRDGYKYEIILKWNGDLEYDQDLVTRLTATEFVKRGVVDGRLYLQFIHPQYRREYSTSVDLNEFSRYSAADARAA